MTILLTSFVAARRELDPKWSAARWAPYFASEWPVLSALAPRRADGRPILLRQFRERPLDGYRDAYVAALRGRWAEVCSELQRLRGLGEAAAVACWCPYSRRTRAQMDVHGSFACHLLLLRGLLVACGFHVELGDEHARFGAPAWKDFEWPREAPVAAQAAVTLPDW